MNEPYLTIGMRAAYRKVGFMNKDPLILT